jgi:Flp pilus assembly protein TadD
VKRALVLILVAGSAYGGRTGDFVRTQRALEEYRLADAKALIDDLLKANPADPEALYLQGDLAFLEGDYDGASAMLGHIDDPRMKDAAVDLQSLVDATREATRGMVTKDSPGGHFTIYYQPGKDEVLVDLAAETLDAAWQTIGGDIGYQPTDKIRVEILPEIRDLARVSTLTEKEIETSGTIALCKYNKLMVVSPRATLLGYPWLDTMAHEFTHYLIQRATNDKVTIWLQEGMAKFEESRWRAAPGADGLGRMSEALLANALRKDKLITFDEMYPSMAKLPSQEASGTAFAEVDTIVAWLETKIGYDGLRDVLARVKDGKTERRAIAEVVGKPWETVEDEWKDHLRQMNLRTDPGEDHKLRFDKHAANDDNVGVDDVPEERARKLARLGGLLRARSRLVAAAAEYEKARAIVPDDPFVGAKLSRTYLELGQWQKAIDVATPLAKDLEDAGPQATLGRAYLQAGDPDKAEPYLLNAVRISPFDPEVRCGLAQIYAGRNDAVHADSEKAACRALGATP